MWREEITFPIGLLLGPFSLVTKTRCWYVRCNRAHQSDISGLAGTYNPEATEIWQEGIRLPVMRLIEQGKVREDLWELLLINCRTPELLTVTPLAMLGSTNIGGERAIAWLQ